MEVHLIIGYFLAIVTGMILGALGGGGSILILPIFVYIFGFDPLQAIVYSLFVIALSSTVGAFSHYKKGNVNLKIVLLFGLSSIASVLVTRKFIVPNLPDVIFTVGDFELKQSVFLLIIFALLMIGAALVMLKKNKDSKQEQQKVKISWLGLIVQGILIGLLTGLVGAGGGFLIVPALIYFTRVSIRIAIGTSLSIIACNTSIGFLGSINDFTIDWTFLIVFASLMIVGILSGIRIAAKLDQAKLKKAFAFLILAVAVFMITKELFLD